MLRNLKRLQVYGCSPFLTHEGLLPHVGRPNFSLQICTVEVTNITLDGFLKIIQVGYVIFVSRAYSCSENNSKINHLFMALYSVSFFCFPMLTFCKNTCLEFDQKDFIA